MYLINLTRTQRLRQSLQRSLRLQRGEKGKSSSLRRERKRGQVRTRRTVAIARSRLGILVKENRMKTRKLYLLRTWNMGRNFISFHHGDHLHGRTKSLRRRSILFHHLSSNTSTPVRRCQTSWTTEVMVMMRLVLQ